MGIFSFGKSAESPSVSFDQILEARERVRGILPVTPLTHSPGVSSITGSDVFFKWDLKFKTGSFKERGAANALAAMAESERKGGVCAASAGNHALALSYHASRFKIPCHILMPTGASLVKVEATKNAGADVCLFGKTFDEAYEEAVARSERHGYKFISAFDNVDVIAGQGTCGLEILEQLPDVDSVIVPIGGGGLISGIASALKAKRPDIFILGVQSEWAAAARAGLHKTGEYAIPPATIADGIAVKKIGQITGPIIEKLVDRVTSISENQIAQAIIKYLEIERTVVEGAGAAALAGLLEGLLPKDRKKTVVLACGSNIDMNLISRLIERDMGERGRLLRIVVSVPDRPGSLYTVSGLIAKEGANVLQVQHDRSLSTIPGNVDITFLAEVRNRQHRAEVLQMLANVKIEAREI